MTSEKLQEIPQSEVSKFYDGKTVLITGAAGFLGTVLLEILLRCCPGIQKVYILLREKKGVKPEERKERILKKDVFLKTKEKYPDVLDKVIAIPGDISQEDLGMEDDYLRKVAEEVTIVFHVAASINFLKPLRFMLLQNAVGTYNVVEVCRKLKHCEVLVYTSTAYSNCNRKIIDEVIYKLPFKAQDIVEKARKGCDEELKMMFDQCTPTFPNFYTFSKCVSENYLAESVTDFPVSIVRPSLILCIWKGSLPGYIEEGSGLYSLSLGIGKGFIRVLQADKNMTLDHIPADIVGNTHVIAAWRQVTERLQSPFVYNCASSDVVPCTWNEFCFTLLEMSEKHPLPNSYQRPGLKIIRNSMAYWFHSILDHYSPAVVIDALLWISGRQPRLFNLYRYYDKSMALITSFSTNEWKVRSKNFQSLVNKINVTDYEMFPVDIREYSIGKIAYTLPNGAPPYKWENDKKSYEERQRTTYTRYLITSFIKWSFIGLAAFMCYAIVF